MPIYRIKVEALLRLGTVTVYVRKASLAENVKFRQSCVYLNRTMRRDTLGKRYH